MPNLPINLDQFRDEIYDWIYEDNLNLTEIVEYLTERLG